MTTEEKTFVIKVPVYTTESKECDTSLFPVTYKNMLDFVIDKIKDFVPANLPSKNKTKTTIVDAIKYYKKCGA